MARPGLLPTTVLLLLLVFAGSFLAVQTLYLPDLEARVRTRMTDVAEDCLATSEEILRQRARSLEEKVSRQLLDLPFELVSDHADRVRDLVGDYATGLTRTWSGNVALLTREFRRRTEARIESRSAKLAEEFRHDALSGVLLLTGAVLALAGLALFRTVLAPLGRLMRATERVSGGDLDAHVDFRGRDEVGRLGRAFDRMTVALRSSRGEIEALNRSLEDKVREKTRALEVRNRELNDSNERLSATISELKETQNALVHSETMASLGTLAGGVAHEFNNLLGGIIGCAEDAQGEEDEGEVKESLGMILRTARRACNITENLLRFSRPPNREAKPTDLARLVRDALDLIGPEAAKRRVTVDAELEDLPPLRLDPGQIHQVVLNLLTNALAAMGDGGRLGVSVREEAGAALIVVDDTGPGISKKARGRIFEPFFTTKETGTGLGLSVSYSIVKGHGGAIEAGDADGGGARFTVRLPLGEDD